MEVKNNYSGISMENIDFDKVRQEWAEQQFGGYASYVARNPIQFKGADAIVAERWNYIENEVLNGKQVDLNNTAEERKPYSEMSMEELKTKLSAAESSADSWKKMLDRTGGSSDEYPRRKAEYNAALDEVNAIKSEIFGRNQEASLSRLNEKSLAALEEYYQFRAEGPGAAKTFMSFLGIYDGNARKMDRDKLEENVVNALKEQGISEKEFDAIFEYYSFKRDAERASQRAAETTEKYENSNFVEKVGMNAETVGVTPIQGVVAAPEMLFSYAYNDPYAPLNVNSPAFDILNNKMTVRAATLNDIESDTGKVAYQVTMNVADASAVAVASGGTGYSVIPSVANASTSAAKTSTERGASKEQALKMAFSSGLIAAFSGKIPLDKVPILQGDDLLTQSLRQGLKQACGTGANAYLDSCINGNNSQFNQRVEAYITEKGLTEEDAIKCALVDALNDMGISCMSGAYSNVTKNVNIDAKINLDSPKITIDMSIAPYNARVNSNTERTTTNATKQQNSAEITR